MLPIKLSEMSIKVMNFDQVVEEYEHLSALPTLTHGQADRLQAILELAGASEEMNYPAASGRGIRIKKEPVLHLGVT